VANANATGYHREIQWWINLGSRLHGNWEFIQVVPPITPSGCFPIHVTSRDLHSIFYSTVLYLIININIDGI